MIKTLFKRKKSPRMVNMLWLNIVFSLFYWIMESVRDVIVFEKGDIMGRIFNPDPMSFWMRMLVIFIFILFSIYSNTLREKIEVKKAKVSKNTEHYGIIWTGAGFAALYWVLEAFRDVFVFGRGDILHRLVLPDPIGFWMRILVVFILLLFSIYAQNLINQRRKVEEDLRKTHEALEKEIAERTLELTRTNDALKKQVGDREKAEEELRRANRALTAFSACNEIMIRAGEETNLLKRICNTLSEMGGYPLVWVSFIEQNGGEAIHAVMQSGPKPRESKLVKLTTDDFANEKNPIGQTVRSGNPTMLKYFSSEGSECRSWAEEALRNQYAALLSLPLKTDGEVFGVLSIYAMHSDAFDMEELKLLEKLADNLAFGIMVLRMRSQRDQAEEEKEKMQAQLLQSHKMEAVGILAGGVAHDFNNLLTAIQVSADLAMMEVEETNSVYKTLKEIHLVSTHAADLARQLLLFSRKHPMEYVSLNLNNTMQTLHKMLKRLIGEDVRIETHADPNLWIVQADRGTMEQVIMNLAVNARDAMPEGGKLSIRTQNVVIDQETASQMPDAWPGRFVRVSVSDTGVGIPSGIMEHIFEPFFSTKGIGKGTGLGLSVVYGIVKQHEGWIQVQSEPDHGTTFHIYLPAAMVESKAEYVTDGDIQPYLGKGERILVIEDDEKVRNFAEKGLMHSGYTVFQAVTSSQAKALFNEEKGNIDLVFCDVVLPDRNGLELVVDLMRFKPDLKVVFTSGYTDHKSQWSVIRDKGFHYIQKPYGLTDLLRTIRVTLDGATEPILQNMMEYA